MARTAVTATRIAPSGVYGQGGDIAEPAGTTIDATLVTNGVALTVGKTKRVLLRVTNTSGAGKQLIVRRPSVSQDTVGVTVGDWTTTAIPLTTGVRYFALPPGMIDPDGTVHIDFQAGHTGVLFALEVPGPSYT